MNTFAELLENIFWINKREGQDPAYTPLSGHGVVQHRPAMMRTRVTRGRTAIVANKLRFDRIPGSTPNNFA